MEYLMLEIGEHTSPVACFVYYEHAAADSMWQHLQEAPHVYRVRTTSRAAFVDRLQAWTAHRDDLDGFLAIVAHMGPRGIHPTERSECPDTILWEELSGLVDTYVDTLWLIGCSSHHAL